MKLSPDNSIGLIVSAIGHAGLLAWGLLSFAPNPLEARPQDAMPIDIISSADFSKMMKGAELAKKADKPKALVDKVGEEKPAPELTKDIAKKTEVKTAAAPPEPPPVPKSKPEPKPEPKPEAKAEPKPEPKPEPKAEPEKKPEPTFDEIAETLKKQQAERQKQAEAEKARADKRRKQDEARKRELAERRKQEEAREKRRFDADKVAALLDRRNPQRLASTGREVNTQPSLGRPDALSMQMSASELDALRARLASLWNPPAGAKDPNELVVRVRIQLTREGRLAGQPQVLSSGGGPLYSAARDSALRALYRGQPYDMLSPANYEIWRDVEITFDPREMLRG